MKEKSHNLLWHFPPLEVVVGLLFVVLGYDDYYYCYFYYYPDDQVVSYALNESYVFSSCKNYVKVDLTEINYFCLFWNFCYGVDLKLFFYFGFWCFVFFWLTDSFLVDGFCRIFSVGGVGSRVFLVVLRWRGRFSDC